MISYHLKTNFFVGLVSLDCTADFECSSTFFEPFSKTETAFSFFFLLVVPVQRLDKILSTLSFAHSHKIMSYC